MALTLIEDHPAPICVCQIRLAGANRTALGNHSEFRKPEIALLFWFAAYCLSAVFGLMTFFDTLLHQIDSTGASLVKSCRGPRLVSLERS